MLKTLNKINTYSVRIDLMNKLYLMKLRVEEIESPIEITFPSICELTACIELLRDENNTFYNPANGEIVITWEPTGENDPKHGK